MATKTGKEVTNWEERLAAAAQEQAAEVRPSSSNITFRSGVVSYEGQPVPDNKLPVVVVGFIKERNYYAEAYDSDNVKPPSCWALIEPGDDEVPDSRVEAPQHMSCETCPMNKFGTARGGSGKGKACQERVRLVAIPVPNEDASHEDILASEVATMKLPVTSVKNWNNYVSFVASAKKRPTWAVVTEVTAKPDPRTQFSVGFDYIGDIEPGYLGALDEKCTMAKPVLMRPYEAGGDDDTPEATGSKHKG